MSAFGRKETKMKDIHKSALLALISIPITIFGVIAGYAIAHGMFAFMLILLAPGMLMMRVFGDSNLPDSMLMGLLDLFFSIWGIS